MDRNIALQHLCREYLSRLRTVAKKFGLCAFLDDMIAKNEAGECKGTQEECELLSRMCDDERLSRIEVPKILGRSYRSVESSCDFDNIKKLRRVGIYSKVDTLLFDKS